MKMTLRQNQFVYIPRISQRATVGGERTETLQTVCEAISRKSMLQVRAGMSCICRDKMASAIHLLRE